MRTRAAMVACVDEMEGPWARLSGDEAGLMVTELQNGERVSLELKNTNPGVPREKYFYSQEGPFPVEFNAARFTHYRIGKVNRPGVVPKPATVEILLNVKT